MSLLAGYYAALNAKNSAEAQAAGQASVEATRAGNERALDGAAQRDLLGAQAQQARAGAGLTAANAGEVAANNASARTQDSVRNGTALATGGLATATGMADIAGKNAQTGLTNQQTTSLAADDPSKPLGFGFETGGLIPGTKAERDETVAQGKGKPGPTDTVPAMLTPGEAVLNKGAVAHIGSDVVDHLNKMGLLRMGAESEVARAVGAPDPHAPPADAGKGGDAKGKGGKGSSKGAKPVQGFATGTSDVKPQLSATTASLFGGPSAGPALPIMPTIPVAGPQLSGNLGLIRALMGGNP